ncbi:MAG: hypothetical protein ACM3YM_03155, partial [Sphingomonadales bacterium]
HDSDYEAVAIGNGPTGEMLTQRCLKADAKLKPDAVQYERLNLLRTEALKLQLSEARDSIEQAKAAIGALVERIEALEAKCA